MVGRVEKVACGCVPPTGSSGWSLCLIGRALIVAYQQAIDRAPGEMAAWMPAWCRYVNHLGQVA